MLPHRSAHRRRSPSERLCSALTWERVCGNVPGMSVRQRKQVSWSWGSLFLDGLAFTQGRMLLVQSVLGVQASVQRIDVMGLQPVELILVARGIYQHEAHLLVAPIISWGGWGSECVVYQNIPMWTSTGVGLCPYGGEVPFSQCLMLLL